MGRLVDARGDGGSPPVSQLTACPPPPPRPTLPYQIAEQYQKTYVTLFEAVSCRDDYACKYEAAIRERDFVQSQLVS